MSFGNNDKEDELFDDNEVYTTSTEEEYFSADEGMEDIDEPPQHHPQVPPQQGYGNIYIHDAMILVTGTLLMLVIQAAAPLLVGGVLLYAVQHLFLYLYLYLIRNRDQQGQ